MRENMKYDTNLYQLRETVLMRMMEIIKNQRYIVHGGTIFFGDSLTEFFDIDKYFKNIEIKYNTGIRGITSGMLLHFIDEGVLKYYPSQVIIMIGTNDLGNTVMASPRDIALNVKEMVEIIHNNLPDCKIVLLSPIPCLKNQTYYETKQGLRNNDILQMIYQEYQHVIPYDYIQMINIYDALCDKQGNVISSYYVDGLHINDDGYKVITQKIKEELYAKVL